MNPTDHSFPSVIEGQVIPLLSFTKFAILCWAFRSRQGFLARLSPQQQAEVSLSIVWVLPTFPQPLAMVATLWHHVLEHAAFSGSLLSTRGEWE